MKKILAIGLFIALLGIMAVVPSGQASAHERCVDNGHVVQVIANGQAEGDPAGYSTNPQGHDRGIRNARDHSPAIASCP